MAELSAAQKGAIVRSIHNPSVHLSFTEGHPRKAAAAEAYRSEMLAKFQAQAAAVVEHVDRRRGDPESGGLNSGEKAAVVRSLHDPAVQLHFAANNPDKQKAAEAYRAAVLEHEAEAAEKAHPHVDLRHGDGHGSLNSGEKAACIRSLHDPKYRVLFTEGHPKKAEAAEAYVQEVLAKMAADAPAMVEKVDKRHGDAAMFGLNSGEKAAIVQSIKDPNFHINFAAGNPEKQKAAEAYRAVVLEQQAQHELEAPQAAPEAAAPQAMA